MSNLETPKTFPLITPITTGKDATQVTELTLREPTAGELEQLERDTPKNGNIGALTLLIAKQTKLPPTDVRTLGARDFFQLQEYLNGFLPSTPGPSDS